LRWFRTFIATGVKTDKVDGSKIREDVGKTLQKTRGAATCKTLNCAKEENKPYIHSNDDECHTEIDERYVSVYLLGEQHDGQQQG
jgi:hypothetical protein